MYSASATISLVKSIIINWLGLARSSTAKDTSILFAGNIFTAFLGFVLLLIVARILTVAEMGVFSAFTNLMLILGSIADPGISSGLIKFVAESKVSQKHEDEKKYISAALKIQLFLFAVIAVLLLAFANTVSTRLLATTNVHITYVLVVAILAQTVWVFGSTTLRARLQFWPSAIVDSTTALLRLFVTTALMLLSALTLMSVTSAYTIATLVAGFLGFLYLKSTFLAIKVKKHHYTSLLKFSSWLGINKISSVISGKIDVQMIAFLAGATATGLYSIPARLIFFVIILISSFSAVISPRLSSFNDRLKEKEYIIKSLLFSGLIIVGLIVWYIVAEPFITILFGNSYFESVQIFRLLLLSTIPFALTAPSVNAIIYGMKKPKYIGYYSVFQLIAVVVLNLIFIPKYGALGPTYTLLITNSVLAVYSWIIVFNYYFKNEKNS